MEQKTPYVAAAAATAAEVGTDWANLTLTASNSHHSLELKPLSGRCAGSLRSSIGPGSKYIYLHRDVGMYFVFRSHDQLANRSSQVSA